MDATFQPDDRSPTFNPDVVEELERVLSSASFRTSPRLSRFLRYVVEQRLAGDDEGLKEYSIGLDVFDRGASFDPRIDTIVRVQAGRLRKRLEQYYAREGRNARFQIEIPKGAYTPILKRAAPSVLPVMGLPAPRNRLIGRAYELRILTELLLREDVRLVTVTGPGGSGKTRLAIAAVSQIADAFPGGTVWLDLASVKTRADLARLVAQAYGLRSAADRPIEEALCERLRATVSTPSLLALDNFEQLTENSDLLSNLLDSCGPLTVLVTSRIMLQLYGEHEFPAPPLPVPAAESEASLEQLNRSAAFQLYIERAGAVCHGSSYTERDIRAIAEVCRRLDGLPLAVELAAARSKTQTPEAVLEELASPLQALTGGPRDVPNRHRTLRAAIDWSYELLSEQEKTFFRRAAVFAGGLTLEGAEAVLDANQDLERPVRELAESLVAKCMLSIQDAPGQPLRFTMLETIREFANEALQAAPDAVLVRRAHSAYFLVIAEEGACRGGQDREKWLSLCDRERANFHSALDWLLDMGAVNWYARMAIALFHYWERRERLEEGRARLETVLRLEGVPPEALARAAAYAGALAGMQGDISSALALHRKAFQAFRDLNQRTEMAREANALSVGYRFTGRLGEARAMLEECLTACQEQGSQNEIAATLSNLAAVAQDQGDFTSAEALLHEAQSIFREIGNWLGVAWSLNHFGDQESSRGRHAVARERYGEALSLFRRLGDAWGEGRTLQDMAELAWRQGDLEMADQLLHQALDVFAELPHHVGIAKLIDGIAAIQARCGNSCGALELAGAAATMRETLGGDPTPWRREDCTRLEEVLSEARSCLGVHNAQASWDRGRAMRTEAAIDAARSLRIR